MHAIFFDFSKTFNLFNHEILLSKIQKILPKWMTSWIAEYLTNRRQRVQTKQGGTEWKQVEAGVVQGSVLGPTLFILFLADINEYISDGVKAPKYADDILAYQIYNEKDEGEPNIMQKVADGISSWTNDNLMKLNTAKTKQLLVNEANEVEISIDNEVIGTTPTYKYLGTQINQDLDWDEQWNFISKRFNSATYLIKTMKNLGFKTEILVTVYRSYILSHIISNSPTLCSTSQKTKDEMNRMQNRVLKIIGISGEEDMRRNKIIQIEELIDKHCKKVLTKILKENDHPLTTQLEHRTARTRNQFPYVINKCRLEKYQNSFLQKYMRELEPEWITPTESTSRPSQHDPTAKVSPMTQCDICKKYFKGTKGVEMHKRKTKDVQHKLTKEHQAN